MNKVSLIGNIVNDLELKDYKNGDKEGKYVRFTLAINEYNVKKNERIATFIEVVAFDKKAIILAHNVGKGSKLAVEGRLQTSNYLNSEGERRYKVDIVLNDRVNDINIQDAVIHVLDRNAEEPVLNEFTFIDNKKKVVNEIASDEVPF